jgi:arylsulfatase A-like enzyme
VEPAPVVPVVEASRPNVVIVTLTAQRRDRLGPYGGPPTPALDGFAAQALVFDRAVAQTHWTLPAQATLLSSRYPTSHGVLKRGQALSDDATTLPELLQFYRYRTGAFVSGLDLDASLGLTQGFEIYDDETADKPIRPLDGTLNAALAWLDTVGDDPFLLYIQSYDAHDPYCRSGQPAVVGEPLAGRRLDRSFLKALDPAGLSASDRAAVVACYDQGVQNNDRGLGRLLAALDRRGSAHNTLMIVLAEHGETLGEHGSYDRFGSQDLYQQVTHVPLMIRGPGVPVGRSDRQIEVVDLMPTVLDFLDIPMHWEVQGESLAALLRGQAVAPAGAGFSETGDGGWAVTAWPWKLVGWSDRQMLFDLGSDPGETQDVARENPKIVFGLSQAYAGWYREVSARPLGARTIEIDPKLRQALEEAGYW